MQETAIIYKQELESNDGLSMDLFMEPNVEFSSQNVINTIFEHFKGWVPWYNTNNAFWMIHHL